MDAVHSFLSLFNAHMQLLADDHLPSEPTTPSMTLPTLPPTASTMPPKSAPCDGRILVLLDLSSATLSSEQIKVSGKQCF